MRYLSYIMTACAFFVLGYFVQDKNAAERVMQTTQETECPSVSLEHSSPPIKSLDVVDKVEVASILNKAKRLAGPEQNSLNSMLEHASNEELNDALSLFFDKESLVVHIDDAQQFSKRIVEELGGGESDIDDLSSAHLSIAITNQAPEHQSDYFEVNPYQKIYAHIDVKGGLGIGDEQFFVRWTNLETQDVLLFKQKAILASSEQNWVSYLPDDAWQEGRYQVTFYQFNSSLKKLASTVFYIKPI